MKTDNMKRVGAVVTMGALGMMMFIGGCAEQPKSLVTAGMERTDIPIQNVPGAPKWTWNENEAFKGEDKKALYGVASASGIRNPSLRRKHADAQARNAMAAVMGTYVAGLHKGFNESTTVGGNPDASEDQHVSDVLKQVTEQSLVGVKIIEYYERPDVNQAYSLAKLDIEQILAMMEKVASSNGQFKQLDAKLRDWVRKNADKGHEQLNEELQKKNQN